MCRLCTRSAPTQRWQNSLPRLPVDKVSARESVPLVPEYDGVQPRLTGAEQWHCRCRPHMRDVSGGPVQRDTRQQSMRGLSIGQAPASAGQSVLHSAPRLLAGSTRHARPQRDGRSAMQRLLDGRKPKFLKQKQCPFVHELCQRDVQGRCAQRLRWRHRRLLQRLQPWQSCAQWKLCPVPSRQIFLIRKF